VSMLHKEGAASFPSAGAPSCFRSVRRRDEASPPNIVVRRGRSRALGEEPLVKKRPDTLLVSLAAEAVFGNRRLSRLDPQHPYER
jgi:hypothetical protein